MNEQLLSHLETFDSDEEFSESPEMAVEEHAGPTLHETMNPFDMYVLRARGILRRFARPESCREAAAKALWLLPIAIALGDYLGFFLSMSLSAIGLIVSQLQPEETHHYHEEMTGHELSMHLRVLSFSTGQWGKKPHPIDKKQAQDCRKEISRLLGLIGAPALDWDTPESMVLGDDLDANLLSISSSTIILVVKFLEAHVQLLLAVDEAYRWLRVSSSLHLGLGPRSQCVERIERASIAREFRNGRRQSIGGLLIANGIADAAREPQRGLCKSVLSLSNVRQHVAKAMVDQSDSILQVWRYLENEMRSSHELSRTDPLDVPDVVDLVWIRNGRHQLAWMLSDSARLYCTMKVLVKLTASEDTQSLIESSMSHARNAREYLVCNLLLGRRRICTPLPNPNDPLLQSLMAYREHLDALSGAIWSCQQYANAELASNEHGRAEWWTQIRQLSETCRAMELEIEGRFFEPSSVGGVDDEEPAASTTSCEQLKAGAENIETYIRDYDDGCESPSEKKLDERQCSRKTVIYKGHGAKSANRLKGAAASKDGSDGEALPLPPRDTVSERQMIRELQNRITLMRPPEEDNSDDEGVKDDDHVKITPMSRKPATPLFLGASGSLLSELKQSMPSSSFGADKDEQFTGG